MFYTIYTACRILSCYPHILYNSQRHSIKYLSFDFLVWSTISFICNILHIACLRWGSTTRGQYKQRFPTDPIPRTEFLSAYNDPQSLPPHPPGASLGELLINLHSLIFITAICAIYQVYYRYKSTHNPNFQEISIATQIIIIGLFVITAFIFISSIPYWGEVLTLWTLGTYEFKWLDVVYIWAAIGATAEWFRYYPQLTTNFVAQRAEGMSAIALIIELVGCCALGGALIRQGLHKCSIESLNRDPSLPKLGTIDTLLYMTQPNSLFFQFIIKTAVIVKLLHQKIVYRRRDEKNRRFTYTQVTDSGLRSASTSLSPVPSTSRSSFYARMRSDEEIPLIDIQKPVAKIV